MMKRLDLLRKEGKAKTVQGKVWFKCYSCNEWFQASLASSQEIAKWLEGDLIECPVCWISAYQ
jgi:hypothetical protein